MRIIAATRNAGKLKELKAVFGSLAEVRGISEYSDTEPEETGSTLRENAMIKAKSAFSETGLPCFADDSGLFVDALDGAPGVYSSRFAPTDPERVARLLKELNGVPEAERTARFGCAVAYCDGKEEFTVEGFCHGRIITESRGSGGFGYDPVFVPDGFEETFAELGDDVKNRISHRAEAMRLLLEELRGRGLVSGQ